MAERITSLQKREESAAFDAWRDLVDSLPVALDIFDVDGAPKWSNRRSLETEPSQRRSLFDEPSVPLGYRPLLERALRGEPVEFPELPAGIVRASGDDPRRWLALRAFPVVREGKQVAVGLWRDDVTSRRVIEAEASRRYALLRTILMNGDVPIAAVSLETVPRLFFVNSAFHGLLGFDGQQLEGQPLSGLLGDPVLGPGLEELVQRGAFRCEGPMRHASGEDVWVEARFGMARHEPDPVAILVLQDVRERRRRERERVDMLRQVARIAETDSLTALPNRDSFLAKAERELVRPGNTTIFLVDLDRFQEINDTYGFEFGDRALVAAANAVKRNVKEPGAMIARMGGDEFAVLLPGLDPHASQAEARALVEGLHAEKVPLADGSAVRLSASVGVAGAPRHGTGLRDLLAAADSALHEAKDRGRNQWRTFDTLSARRQMMATLWAGREEVVTGIREGSFLPFFQPILSLANDRIEKHEVLARRRSGSGIVSPAEFLPAAEHFGLVHLIDMEMLKQGLDAVKDGPPGSGRRTVAVNLSALSLDEDGLASEIRSLLRLSGVPPESIVLEITETTAIRNLPRARLFMETLTDEGIGFALDDFGVGFASYSHLRTLPLKYVKFDMSLVERLAGSSADRILLQGMNDMTHGLGLKSIAEGVESVQTLEILRELGVDAAQGYLIGRPRPSMVFEFAPPGPGTRSTNGPA